ncbi:MMPL family transporter [Cellulomonas oligotrophica]|uniref:Membrane protein n=1 Tax=Cellulomonas oligotrophica TaxID=931536 RepID=A0A7Y9FG03_9CELL|nr:MMPL family transporter [Cellulomonas oligotrophica]NYD86620.1 RND superfamily putative drug exporter [Cellulomonas oligotrophica]GIG32492.1 membrane protein [Cellulomonas oligotrophica]
MSLALYRLGHAVGRHRLLVVVAWAVLLLVVLGLARTHGGEYDDDFSIPGTESEQGMDVLAERFGTAAAGASAQVLYRGEDVTAPDAWAAVEASLAAVEAVDGVAGVTAAEKVDVTAAHDAALATVQLEDAEPSDATLDALRDAAVVDTAGVTSTVGGNAYGGGGAGASHTAEAVGLGVALVVLALTFGSLVAAGLPILTALLGVAATIAGLQLAASAATISTTTPSFASMLGLAVGIDYALFVLSRHRAQLADGVEPRESMARALGTAGSAVVFAGATVVVSLVGLVVVGIPVLTWMGLGGALAVTLAVAAALTLLPAVALLLGTRLRPRERRPRAPRTHPARAGRPSLAARWVALVTRVPVLTVVLVVLGLGAAALPAADLQLALTGGQGGEPGTPERAHADAVADAFGAGSAAPLLITADILGGDDPRATVEDLAAAVGDVDGVVEVTAATPNAAADTALVRLVPPGGASDPATVDLVHRLREAAPAIEAQTGATDLLVTGSTAVTIDVQELLADAVVPFGATVVGLSLVLLALVFRSVAVPLKATVGFLLSVGASLGAIVAVFQWGWGADLVGVAEPGPVVSFLPVLVIGVLFGLAMDYEMFLVSRMREEYTHHGDARGAVLAGFTHSAPVVAAAALIMVAVFAAFVPGGSTTLQAIAFGLAVGVLVDAFVVRMTLVPAVLVLLGDRAWWMPGWLARRLPVVDVEGEAVVRSLDATRAAAAPDAPAVRARGLVPRPGDTPLDVDAPAGAVTVVTVGSDAAADAAARALTGRARVGGDVAVGGLVLPEQRERVRRATALVVADPPLRARTVERHVAGALALLGTPRRRRADLVARVGQITGLRGPVDALTRSERRLLVAAVAHVHGAHVLVLPGPPDTDLAAVLVRHGATVVLLIPQTAARPEDRPSPTAPPRPAPRPTAPVAQEAHR